MASQWTVTERAAPGQYVLGSVISGVNFNVLAGVTTNEIMAAVSARQAGWAVSAVRWTPGLFGIGESLIVTGQASANISTADIAAQIANAVNSFWFIGGASVSVAVSDSSELPPESSLGADWASTVKWAAVAVLAIAVVYGLTQIRRTFNE